MTAAVSVENISKRFRLYHERPSSLKERLLRMRRSRAEDFWALRDISFELEEGKTLGLVGANGSGKTTLLKVIGGILRPTSGRVVTRGRIAALLELGAGFHPELTGRENVYLNASILGLSKKETDLRFDDIVGFAELEEFIDNQVKFYSSGMYVRLGFAVAVHVDPGILLVDEVLSVGDESFQRKCMNRVKEFQREGRTIVFVTHAVEKVRDICDEALMLERGRMKVAGEVNPVLRAFRLAMLASHVGVERMDVTHDIEITGVTLLDGQGRPAGPVAPGDPLVVQVEIRANRSVTDPVMSLSIHDATDQEVYQTTTARHGLNIDFPEGGKQRVTFELGSIPFIDGRHFLSVGVNPAGKAEVCDWHDQQYTFEITDTDVRGRVYIPTNIRVERL